MIAWRHAAAAKYAALASLLLLLTPSSSALYVPTYSLHEFHDNDRVEVLANKAFSDLAPLPYSLESLEALCPVPAKSDHLWLNLGEVLRGDRIVDSGYQFEFGHNDECRVLCKREVTSEAGEVMKQLIQRGYRAEYIVDNLPGATKPKEVAKLKRYTAGFPLGVYEEESDTAYINNHLDFTIVYEAHKKDRKRIVGFEVAPRSILNSSPDGECPKDLARVDHARQAIKKRVGNEPSHIVYSYSVKFVEDSSVTWYNRWDRYLDGSTRDTSIHWYAVGNSVLLTLMLTAVVALILLRILNRDIAFYNDEEMREDLEETTGWKLLHGDVFRSPRYGGLLAPIVGTGVQVVCVGIATTALSVLGLVSPAVRGGLLTVVVLEYSLMGVFGGYWSARLYKTWHGTRWLRNGMITALVGPLVAGSVILPLNILVWYRGSSSAIPLGTFVVFGALWLVVMAPLTVLGAFIGQRRPTFEHPLRTNAIPRPIPPQRWYLQSIPSMCIAGALPFSVVFIELFFILNSVWQDQFYYMYGFLTIVGAILVITIIEVTVVTVYFQLCNENHQWWWSSFRLAAGGAIYIFAYSVHYYASRLRAAHLVGTLMFFSYSMLACLAYAVGAGAIGMLTTYYFTKRIYAAVKLD
ncbi:hypothetical protein GQ42DRAFT_119018 [Ramicandelaber brevisporus]|nr:hypothetical protein GQ42DRAFT_119018 [Ramicandelaber brevisporus]